jgi:hypothetical protein
VLRIGRNWAGASERAAFRGIGAFLERLRLIGSMSTRLVIIVAGTQCLLRWASLGVLQSFGFHAFSFVSYSDSSIQPRVLPIHMLFVHVNRLLSYPLSLLPQPAWLPYSWFFTGLLFAANSLVWGAIVALLLHPMRARPHHLPPNPKGLS